MKHERMNLSQETPKDQEWVHCEDFERELYNPDAKLIEARPITQGPKFHWFGYYDKFQLDPTERFALSMEVAFEHRSPQPGDVIDIGMVDLQDDNRWIPLGRSQAWSWQQGCMLQWRPGSSDEVLWNDRAHDRFVCRILNVKTGEKRALDHPVYHVHPNGRLAVGTDFARIQLMRPGYGYAGVDDPNADVLSPDDAGMYMIDLDTGDVSFLFSYADIAGIPYPQADPNDDKHYFNAPAWNNDGSRFLFLDRWRSTSGKWDGFRTRMFTASPTGDDLRLVTDKPGVSHFTWRDPQHIALWREGAYRLYRDDGSYREETILNATNGHLSYLPGNEWLLADTYMDADGNQNPFLFHIPTGKIVPIGHFHSPPAYKGEWRCDLHPRISRDGRLIIIDSTHGGNGRQQYLLDISEIVHDA